MSEWWRRSKRLEEAGEVAPSGRPIMQLVEDAPAPDPAARYAELMARVSQIDATLSKGNAPNEYGRRMRVTEYRDARARLLSHRGKVIAELQAVKAEVRAKNITDSAVSRQHHDRLLALLLACRTILVGFDLAPEEQEVVNAAGEYLKKARMLP